jgi:hypothetical protein
VWLEKSRAPADSVRSYHVVDRRGRLRSEVRLHGNGRILGIGEGSVLVAESNPDGTRILRVLLPRSPDSP